MLVFTTRRWGKSILSDAGHGVLGILEGASRVLKIAFREEGDAIFLLDGAAWALGAQQAAPLLGTEA